MNNHPLPSPYTIKNEGNFTCGTTKQHVKDKHIKVKIVPFDQSFQNKRNIDHTINSYVNLSYNPVNKDNHDNFQITQHDIDYNFIIPTPKHSHRNKLLPIVLISIKAINGVLLTCPLLVLWDSGKTSTIIKHDTVPYGLAPIICNKITTTTTQGMYTCDNVSFLKNIQLSYFVNGRSIQGFKAHMFDLPVYLYDIILGWNFLHTIRMEIDFKHGSI